MSSPFLDLSIGDTLHGAGAFGLPPLFRPGRPRWHALFCRPQREDHAERWLARRGVYAFHPVLMRRTRRGGRVFEYPVRYLPGYVFARFPGEALPHAVLAGDFLTGALELSTGREGAHPWAVIHPADLRALHNMRQRDADTAALRASANRARRAAARLAVGEGALFRAGVFAGHRCEVVEIDPVQGPKVRLHLFGREALVTAAPDDLVRIGGESSQARTRQ